MCEPVSATMAAVAVIGAASSMYSQNQQMHAQASYQQAQADANAQQMTENAKLANSAYIEQTKQLQIRNMQEGEAANQQIMTNDIAGEKARATAKASASDSGVSGLSVNALMDDFHRQQDNYDTTVKTNQEWSKSQLGEDMKSAEATAQGRIASVRPYIAAPIKTPDYLGAAMGAAGSIYQIGSKAEWWTTPKGK
jgi:hypothetical protein